MSNNDFVIQFAKYFMRTCSYESYFEKFLMNYNEVFEYMKAGGVMERNVLLLCNKLNNRESLKTVGLTALKDALTCIIMQYHFYVSGNVYDPLLSFINDKEFHDLEFLQIFPTRLRDRHNPKKVQILSRKSIEGCLFDIECIVNKFRSLDFREHMVRSINQLNHLILLIMDTPNREY